MKPYSDGFLNATSKRMLNILLRPGVYSSCNKHIKLDLKGKSGKYKALIKGFLPCEDSAVLMLKNSEEKKSFCGLVQESCKSEHKICCNPLVINFSFCSRFECKRRYHLVQSGSETATVYWIPSDANSSLAEKTI